MFPNQLLLHAKQQSGLPQTPARRQLEQPPARRQLEQSASQRFASLNQKRTAGGF
jgi:hypothetical protein